jgi:hypothetical protein
MLGIGELVAGLHAPDNGGGERLARELRAAPLTAASQGVRIGSDEKMNTSKRLYS